MFAFYKEFKVTTIIDGYGNVDEEIQLRKDKFGLIMKFFGIGYEKPKKRIVEYPQELLKRGNILKFGSKCAIVLSWKCLTTPENYERFKKDVNSYFNETLPFFNVYESL